jgi:uncharacterized protein (TIGR03083 family)
MAGSASAAIDAVERGTNRFTTLLRSGLDPQQRVKRSQWTVAQLGAHLASGAVAYHEMADGGQSPYVDFDARAATNQARLEELGEDDLSALANVIDEELGAVVAEARRLRDDAVMQWHGGLQMPLGAYLGALVGELVFHGQDLARTVKQPWPIEPSDAFPVIDFVAFVTPHILNPAKTADLTTRVELRVRDYETMTFVFEPAKLTVEAGGGKRRQVTMSVDPIALLQVAYKRSSLTRPILTGKAVAWGRRPWIALRFPGYFEAP